MKIFITISPAITGYLRKTQTMKKVFIRTFGCQMNEYDSEKMLAVLAEENDETTPQPPLPRPRLYSRVTNRLFH